MEKIKILTPEQIELEYQLAGLGSRFIAVVIDHIIQLGMLGIIYLGILIVAPDLSSSHPLDFFRNTLVAILMIISFAVFMGYFMLFESIWAGQTPGKKFAQIRVIKETGQPIRFIDTFLRNILRPVDFLYPMGYPVGVFSILLSKKNKRIGDIVAGTLVIKVKEDAKPVVLPDLKVESALEVDIGAVTSEDFQKIRDFILRRNDLFPQARKKLAEKLAIPLITKMNMDPQNLDTEEFLEVVAVRYREGKKSM